MPPNHKKKNMQLQCEWYDCETKCTTMEAFTLHMHKHIEEFLPPGITVDNYMQFQIISQDEYHCQWTDCGFVTQEGPVMLIRHLLFHAYHCKIKWWATLEQKRCKMGPCMLDLQTRNLIPELPQKFQCAWVDATCGFTTDNAEHFYRHADMHANVAEPELVGNQFLVKCKWSECTGCYKDKYKLLDHLRSHTQEKRHACCQCGALFSNRTKYMDHIQRQTAIDLQSYQCSHCSKIFASERLLRDHMRHHVNHYKCPFCDMTCPAPSGLKSHIKYRHSEERLHECPYCSFKAKGAADLRRHITTHEAGKGYWCEYDGCDFTARSVATLKRHYSREHVENREGLYKYCCHVCSTRFVRGFNLTWHLKQKHKFKWPSGHCRFRYKEHDDGLLRLQTVRYESIELTQQILAEKEQSKSSDGGQSTSTNAGQGSSTDGQGTSTGGQGGSSSGGQNSSTSQDSDQGASRPQQEVPSTSMSEDTPGTISSTSLNSQLSSIINFPSTSVSLDGESETTIINIPSTSIPTSSDTETTIINIPTTSISTITGAETIINLPEGSIDGVNNEDSNSVVLYTVQADS